MQPVAIDEMRGMLVEQLGVQKLSPEEQNEVFAMLRKIILAKTDEVIGGMLSDAQKAELKALYDKQDNEGARAYLYQAIPNLPFIMETTALSVLEEASVRMKSQASQ